MDKIKAFLKNKYDNSGTVTKSVFNSIVRTMVSFGLVCVAALFLYVSYYSVFTDEQSEYIKNGASVITLVGEGMQNAYEASADESGNKDERYNPANYDFSQPLFLGQIVGDGANGNRSTIATPGYEQNYSDYIDNLSSKDYNLSSDDKSKIKAMLEKGAEVRGNQELFAYLVKSNNEYSVAWLAPSQIAAYRDAVRKYGSFEAFKEKYFSGELSGDDSTEADKWYNSIVNGVVRIGYAFANPNRTDMDMNEAVKESAINGMIKAFFTKDLSKLQNNEQIVDAVRDEDTFFISNANEGDFSEEVNEEGESTVVYNPTEDNQATPGKEQEYTDTMKFEDLLKKYVTTEIFTGVGYATAHPIWAMLNSLFEEFMSFLKTEFWNPNVYELSSINIGSGTVGFFNFYFSLMNMFKVIGAVIVVFLFLFGLFLSMFSTKLSNIKDTPLQLVARLGISLFLITLTTKICDWFVGIIGELWETYLDSTPLNQSGTFNIADLFCLGVPASASAATEWEANGSFLRNFWTSAIMINPALHTCAMLIGLLIMWPILKQFLALAVEIIERALVLLIIYALAPLAYASLASSATSSIFNNYIKMLMSQLVILASNNLFVAGFCYLVSKGVQKANLCGYVFTLSYLRTAQRFDSYLKTLGLSATQTGGQVIESIGMAAHNLSRTIRQGNEMRKGAGTLVEAAGVAAGSTGLVKAGKALGMSTESMSQAMNSGGGGVLGTVNALADIGRRGNSTKANNSTVENVLAGVSKNPTDTMQYAARGINEKSYTNFAQSKGLDVEKFDKVNFSHANNGVISMSGIDKAGNAVKYEISNDASAARDHSKVVDLKDGKGNVTGYMYEV